MTIDFLLSLSDNDDEPDDDDEIDDDEIDDDEPDDDEIDDEHDGVVAVAVAEEGVMIESITPMSPLKTPLL